MPRRALLLGAAVALLVLAPTVLSTRDMDLFIQAFFLGALGLSLNLLVTFAGLPSLAHAAFFGIGAYTAGTLAISAGSSNLWVTLAVAAAVAAVTSVLFGLVALRTRGPYFLIITLSLAGMVWGLAVSWRGFTGGDDGLLGITSPSLWPLPLEIDSRTKAYLLALAGLLVVGGVVLTLVRSAVGRVLVGVRDSETRMEGLGFATGSYRLMVFVVSGVLGTVPGVLSAYHNLFVSPSDAHFLLSAEALLVVVLGGGTIVGPVIGALAVTWLEEILTSVTDHWLLLLGAVYVLVALLDPRRAVRLVTRPRSGGGPAVEEAPPDGTGENGSRHLVTDRAAVQEPVR